MKDLLNPKKALIFRITHRGNLPWILENGLRSASSSRHDPDFISIGNAELIGKRVNRAISVAPGGTLSDYVPFYFTPRSPMLMNIKTGYNGVRQRRNDEIIVLVTSLPKLAKLGQRFLFTDRHAYLAAAQFFGELGNLDQIDWSILQRSDFRRDNNDLGKFERYQAEALVYKRVLPEALMGIGVVNANVRNEINEILVGTSLQGKAFAQPTWYF